MKGLSKFLGVLAILFSLASAFTFIPYVVHYSSGGFWGWGWFWFWFIVWAVAAVWRFAKIDEQYPDVMIPERWKKLHVVFAKRVLFITTLTVIWFQMYSVPTSHYLWILLFDVTLYVLFLVGSLNQEKKEDVKSETL